MLLGNHVAIGKMPNADVGPASRNRAIGTATAYMVLAVYICSERSN